MFGMLKLNADFKYSILYLVTEYIMAMTRKAVAFITIHPQISKRVTAKSRFDTYKGNGLSGRDHYTFGSSGMSTLM